MSVQSPVNDGGAFAAQAAVARQMGSEFVAQVLEAGLRQLARAPLSAALIHHWQGDRAADALALRFNGALHALARRRATPALAELYNKLCGDFDAVVGDVLAREDAFIEAWLRNPPQTNEVGRSAAIWAALTEVARQFEQPVELLELGSSAGLNLNLAQYRYELGGVVTGNLASPLMLRPEWRGPPPPAVPVEVRSARGVDIDPLDVRDAAARERLTAFVWPDDRQRGERLAVAIALAGTHPIRVDQANAGDWIAARLMEPQDFQTTRVVFQSIVLQYLPPNDREPVRNAIHAAGERADLERPLAWISYEWDARRGRVALALTTLAERRGAGDRDLSSARSMD